MLIINEKHLNKHSYIILIMDRLSQMVGTQSTMLLTKSNSSDDSSSIYYMFLNLCLSSLLMTFVHTLSNHLYLPYKNLF